MAPHKLCKNCKKFAKSLGLCPSLAQVKKDCKSGSCLVDTYRKLHVCNYVTGQRLNHPMIVPATFGYQKDKHGRVYSMAEIAGTEQEILQIAEYAGKKSLNVSALSNRWANLEPNLLVINIFSDKLCPDKFARKIKKVLKKACSYKLGNSVYDTIKRK